MILNNTTMKGLKKAEFIYLTTVSIFFLLVVFTGIFLKKYIGDWAILFTAICGAFFLNIVGFISSKIAGEEKA